MRPRNRLTLVLACVLVLLPGLLFPEDVRADMRFVLTPFAGIENGGEAFGGNLRLFFLPNLAVEADAGIGESICQNCRLSETTFTANLVYEIHPVTRLSFFVLTGSGVGLADLSSPESARATLGVWDIGLGSSLCLIRHVALTIENRWFLPISGAIPGVSGGAPGIDRLTLGISTSF